MTAKHWLWVLVVVVLGYVAVTAWMFLTQEKTLYPATTYTPQWAEALARREGLAPWPPGTPVPRGYLAESTTGSTEGTVIVFHGNGGSALDRTYYALALNRLGYRVLLAEYPGYGARPGRFGERSFVTDALEIFDSAQAEFGAPVFVVGESLGAGVASAVARDRVQEVAGVALITPWDSLPDLAQAKNPYFPARFLTTSKYDNVANLAEYRGPIAVAMALNDELIPNAHTRRLYDSLGQPKRLWRFEAAGHNTWPSSPEEPWWAELTGFWEGRVTQGGQ